jgi:urocanate hydratase
VAQPLAGRMAGAAILCVEVDPERAEKRRAVGYLDEIASDLEAALARIEAAVKEKRPLSVGLAGNAADVYPEIARRGITPDVVTDQTSAHDLVYGYVPKGMSLQEPQRLRGEGQGQLMTASRASIADEVRAMLEMFPNNAIVTSWIRLARPNIPFEGLPARIAWLSHGERAALALLVNDLVAWGELAGPIAFSRDHLDARAMAHPNIMTERMKDGSDAIADWPLLDAMMLRASMADLVALHSGGGGYSGYMTSAGVTVIADGTAKGAERLAHALTNDTALGLIRYADAGIWGHWKKLKYKACLTSGWANVTRLRPSARGGRSDPSPLRWRAVAPKLRDVSHRKSSRSNSRARRECNSSGVEWSAKLMSVGRDSKTDSALVDRI